MEVNSMCRLCCASVNGDGLSIFGDDGKRNLLQSKIKLYLHFSVAEDDDLPKVLCSACVSRLNNIHRFAAMALCMQGQLQSRLGPHALQNSDIPAAFDLMQSVCTEPLDIKHENSDEEFELMEMEVDPMAILCLEDENDYSLYDSSEGFRSVTDALEIKKLDNTYKLEIYPEMNEIYSSGNLGTSRNSRSLSFGGIKRGNAEVKASKLCPGIEELSESILESKEQINETSESVDNKPCEVCWKSFESISESGTPVENDNSPVKCGSSICNRLLWSKLNLDQHQTNKNKDYICKECGRDYSTKGSLRQHLVTHSNARPHKCYLCPKSFKRNQDLKFHMNQHTGERPYLCPFCPKAFASSGNCFSHRKRMHPQETQQSRSLPGNHAVQA